MKIDDLLKDSPQRVPWRPVVGITPKVTDAERPLPVAFALTGAKADERQVLLDVLGDDPALLHARQGQTMIADKNYYGHDFETTSKVLA